MRHGLICDDARASGAVRIEDIDHQPMGWVIATDEATISIYILFVLSRPELDHQAWVI